MIFFNQGIYYCVGEYRLAILTNKGNKKFDVKNLVYKYTVALKCGSQLGEAIYQIKS